jgi:pyridoxal phosphate enzyme (YggS family)
MIHIESYQNISKGLNDKNVTLVAVSKTKPVADILSLYDLGQRDFGENYVQELAAKQPQLPDSIRWHYIGHLQTNKVKYIAPFVQLIHTVDSFKLLTEINRQAFKNKRVIDVLLQLHIAQETTKYGMDNHELLTLLEYYEAQKNTLQHVRIRGLMGMASFSEDVQQVRGEFRHLRNTFENLKHSNFLFQEAFDICSMGMSGDYKIAIEEGSTLVRIGSLIFGER